MEARAIDVWRNCNDFYNGEQFEETYTEGDDRMKDPVNCWCGGKRQLLKVNCNGEDKYMLYCEGCGTVVGLYLADNGKGIFTHVNTEKMVATGEEVIERWNKLRGEKMSTDVICASKIEGCTFLGMKWRDWKKKIKRVIFNGTATIILWESGEKTVVKCGRNEIYDPEKGLAMALCKYVLGNKSNFNQFFKAFL